MNDPHYYWLIHSAIIALVAGVPAFVLAAWLGKAAWIKHKHRAMDLQLQNDVLYRRKDAIEDSCRRLEEDLRDL